MNASTKIFLIADDDLDDLELLEEAILQVEPDSAVCTVSSGNEVMEYLDNCQESELPCLIVVDYNMPDMTGAKVVETLGYNKKYKDIPALVWSTSDALAYKRECEEKGAKAYFYKPHHFKQMVETAKSMLSYCSTALYQ